MIWQCPHCEQPLQQQENQWRCDTGHSFDRAREGYVHLLPANRKRSREPGDSAEMLQSRRQFLEAGYYRPLADAICAQLPARENARLLDLGCGEGYYARQLLAHGWREESVTGIDIAKSGVRLAAKRMPAAQFAVASSFHLPVLPQSHDAVLRVFAPGPAEEIARILKPDGQFLDITPGPEHLWSLKTRLYSEPRPHRPPADLEGFTLLSELRCCFLLNLKGQEHIANFLAMTPFAWTAARKGQDAAREALSELDSLQLEADFLLRRWGKN